MTTPTATHWSGGSLLARALRVFAVLPVLLMLAGVVGLAVIENSLAGQKEQLSRRIQVARNTIEPLTSIRRDARKHYVALLERWLAPARDWPRLRDRIEEQTKALLRSSQDFLHGVALTAGEQQHRVDLAAHIAVWGSLVSRILETAVGPEVLAEARAQLSEIDRNCAAVLAANLDGSRAGGMGTIRIRTSTEGNLACIDITDSGSCIPKAIRNRVFEPFFTTKEVGKGTGQGLAIARSVVVTKHGGTISFESEVGKGTTFTIRLPVASSAGGDAAS